MKLTQKQREALESLLIRPRSVWDFGSTTVNVLRKNGLVETAGGMLVITAVGRASLGGAQ